MADLPSWRGVLAVTAHPDDESFGLGAVIDSLVRSGGRVDVLCLTRGEAATAGAGPDLAERRQQEYAAAAAILGISAHLRAYGDGQLSTLAAGVLADEVERAIMDSAPEALLVFDTTGFTGHPDHMAATAAAVAAAERFDLPVLAWTLTEPIAAQLRNETGIPFGGRAKHEIDFEITVNRATQIRACRCHASQSGPDSPLWRRLQVQGDREYLRWLRRVPDGDRMWGRPLSGRSSSGLTQQLAGTAADGPAQALTPCSH